MEQEIFYFAGTKKTKKPDFWTSFFKQNEKKVSLEFPKSRLQCLDYILKAA